MNLLSRTIKILGISALLLLAGCSANVGGRTQDTWTDTGSYLRPIKAVGEDILIYNASGVRYLNFGITSGSSGYGIRNNGGNIELKNSGGNWGQLLSAYSNFLGTWDGLATTSFLSTYSDFKGTWDGYATNTLPYLSSSIAKGNFFVGSSRDTAQATSTIFVYDGKIGIATTTPAYNLDIYGSVGARSFMINPKGTATASSTGKIAWDTTWHTPFVNLDDSVSLQLGQESHVFTYNGTGNPIINGQVVYSSTANSGFPSIALAKADAESTSFVLGVVTSKAIQNGSYGYVTTFGMVNDLNTSAWSVGDLLYLSPSTAGALTNVQPSGGQYDVKVARVEISDATSGRIFVYLRQQQKLTDLADVTITTPAVDQIIKYNGTEWVNGNPGSQSAGPGSEFFYSNTAIIASSTQNAVSVETLAKSPTTAGTKIDLATTNANTVLNGIYLYDTALGRTTLDGGVWRFNDYLAVDSATAVTENLMNVMRVRVGTGTASSSGSGTTRTVNASTGTPFDTASIDVGGTVDTDSYLRTTTGVFRILSRVSDTRITIATPATYTNQTGVAFSVHKKLFGITSGEINNTGAGNPLLFTTSAVEPAFTTLATDKLAVYRFAKTTRTSNTIVYYFYQGTQYYSHIETPLGVLHNDLAGLQGGAANDYYHLTQNWVNKLQAWQQASTTKIALTDLSCTATGLTYNNATGVFSWTSGYEGLLTSSKNKWNALLAASTTLPYLSSSLASGNYYIGNGQGTAEATTTPQIAGSYLTSTSSVSIIVSSSTIASFMEDKVIYDPKQAITLTRFTCTAYAGTSIVVNLSDGTNDTTAITCGTSRTTIVPTSNTTFTKGESVQIEFGTNTGSSDGVSFQADFVRTSFN